MRRRSLRTRAAVWFSKRNNRHIFFLYGKIIVFSILTVSFLLGLLYSPLLSVRLVKVSVESNTDQAMRQEVFSYIHSLLDEYSYGFRGKTRYLFKRKKVEDMILKNFSQISSVHIANEFFNIWNVKVHKRETFGTFCGEAGCFLIDSEGVVFGKSDMNVGVTIKIRSEPKLGGVVFIGARELAMKDFNTLVQSVQYLEENGLFVDDVEIQRDSRAVNINLNNGITVLMDASETVFKTTRAIHIVFMEVLKNEQKRSRVHSVNIRNPSSILYEER